MEIPVYVFTGFLESGKTTFINEILQDPNFTEDEHTLLLLCEEGETPLDLKLMQETHTIPIEIEEQAQMTPTFLKGCERQYQPDRVIIEYNGMWKVADLEEMLPKNWSVYQIVTTVCSGTFELYAANMGTQMLEQIANADLVVFNRATDADKETIRKRNVRAMNPRATIYFENEDGTAEDYLSASEPPYDMDADPIEISDLDFGLWYLDAMNAPEKYEERRVRCKGMVYRSDKVGDDAFVVGRFGMVCCANDISFVGFLCKTPLTETLEDRSFVYVTAVCRTEYVPQYRGEGPVLYAEAIEPAEKPEEEIVYFN